MTTAADARLKVLLAYPPLPENQLVAFGHMMPFFPGRRAVMPPLGLLTFAGMLPDSWDVRLVDENVEPVADSDLAWADVVCLSGMHPQRRGVTTLLRRAREHDCLTVLGGPSVTVCPEYYPEAHVLHLGEVGDATTDLVAYLARRAEPPETQVRFSTEERLPLEELPLPALHLLARNAYFTMPLQFSVGCPFQCEFCDIPVIYGRRPRAKSPERVLREMQAIYDYGHVGAIVFVDDNINARRNALESLLPALAAWQKEHGYPFRISTESTLDLARHPHLLKGLRDARVTHIFFGVESTDRETLISISKRHNTKTPMIEALRTVQSYGIEALIGLILGFDTDRADGARRIAAFVAEAKTPIVYFNLLTALPGTPLWARLESERRLDARPDGDVARSDELLTCLQTNIRYLRPNEQVKEDLLHAIGEVYAPTRVYDRYRWNAENVYVHQRIGRPPIHSVRDLLSVLRFSVGTLRRVIWRLGIRGTYRGEFWRFVGLLLRLRMRGRIGSVLEFLLLAAPTAHHLVTWAATVRDEAARAEAVPAPGSRASLRA